MTTIRLILGTFSLFLFFLPLNDWRLKVIDVCLVLQLRFFFHLFVRCCFADISTVDFFFCSLNNLKMIQHVLLFYRVREAESALKWVFCIWIDVFIFNVPKIGRNEGMLCWTTSDLHRSFGGQLSNRMPSSAI